jgi:urocanate hydratase
LILDSTKEVSRRLESMIFLDVNNGISRRNLARNEGATFAIKKAIAMQSLLKVTIHIYLMEYYYNQNIYSYE